MRCFERVDYLGSIWFLSKKITGIGSVLIFLTKTSSKRFGLVFLVWDRIGSVWFFQFQAYKIET